MTKTLLSNEIDIDVIRFINKHRQLDANKFYEKIRHSYNNKKSNLYINIVREELDNPDEVLTTLSSLNLQILLFARTVQNKEMFLRHMRFQDICATLLNYSKTYDLVPCIKLLQIIKADLKAFEYFNKEDA